jgi:hypothetical protein
MLAMLFETAKMTCCPHFVLSLSFLPVRLSAIPIFDGKVVYKGYYILHVVPSFPFIGQTFFDREVLGACIRGGGGGRGKRPQSAKSILKR